jgi:ectoine hydroxylase-related dioxygenase (phytanoyl-CoA dioxygenase family)
MKQESFYPLHKIEQNGFALVKSVVPEVVLDRLTQAIDSVRFDNNSGAFSAGLRYLFRCCPEVVSLAKSPEMIAIVSSVIGESAHPVRAIFFDKTIDSNWYVTWHQDLTIAVKEKVDSPGFGPWSVKDAIPHVQPPVEILSKMISLRLHLDLCSEVNGAIKFIPGSHNDGVFNTEQIVEWRAKNSAICCPAERGDVIAMRPLILHSSSRATDPLHRRVLHLEYAAHLLPSGIQWSEVAE